MQDLEKNKVERNKDGSIRIEFKYGTVVTLSTESAKQLLEELQEKLK